uniref:Uncharacterized protein n=1 Tax=Anguilla anguilla TaxID=7936 RepID=A0A0E9VGA2_ANGAN
MLLHVLISPREATFSNSHSSKTAISLYSRFRLFN